MSDLSLRKRIAAIPNPFLEVSARRTAYEIARRDFYKVADDYEHDLVWSYRYAIADLLPLIKTAVKESLTTPSGKVEGQPCIADTGKLCLCNSCDPSGANARQRDEAEKDVARLRQQCLDEIKSAMSLADEFERRLEAVLEEGAMEETYQPELRALGKWLTHHNDAISTALREYENNKKVDNS